MSSPNITLAVVIATFNREKELVDTIESLLKLEKQPDEVFIVDQTAKHSDETENYLKKINKSYVHVIRLPEPGVCFARNLGVALAKSDVILFLDDDVIIKDHQFIENHLKNYHSPRIDAVQGQILLPISKEAISDLNRYEPMFKFSSWEENLSPFVTANVSVRRDVLLKMGGFDEGFSGRTYANEDGDLGKRMRNCGCRIGFDPAASLFHIQTPSGGNRITGRDAFPEWTRSVTFFQFALRHSTGKLRFKRLFNVFRLITLRKENVCEPWCLPSAFISAFYALLIAVKRHRAGFCSSINVVGVENLRRQYLTTSIAC